MSRRGANKNGRSKGEHSKFFALEVFIMETPAWRSLSLAARAVYLEIGALYNQTNNGKLALSARQAADRMPIGRASAWRAFAELQGKGFIVACRPSGFNMKSGERRATEWRLTRYKCNVTDALPSKDFVKWRPDKVQDAASPQRHPSFTTKPPKAKKAGNSPEVASTRSRQPESKPPLSFTTEPLLESTIGYGPLQRGSAANQRAGADPSSPTIIETNLEGLKPLRDVLDLSKLTPQKIWPLSEAA